jgi:hypothetical protein
MFRSMSNDHHDHPSQPSEPLRFTFKRRFRRREVFEDIVSSGWMGADVRYYVMTSSKGVTVAIPVKGRRILIEKMP